MTAKTLPQNITSYDLLKFAAVIIMVIDHIGWYFFPYDLWWRAVGRIGFPVWFFLVGYASGRDFSWKLWAGMFVLLAGNIVAGIYILPVNALATIILIRLVIDPLMRGALSDMRALTAISAVLLVVVYPSSLLVEYGTQALIMAMFGYLVRHRDRLALKNDLVTVFTGFALISFVVLQYLSFGFDDAQLAFMAAGTLVVVGILYIFRPMEFPGLTAKLPRPLTALIRFGGRRTLEIYVAHLMLFKFAGMIVDPHRFSFLDFTLFFE